MKKLLTICLISAAITTMTTNAFTASTLDNKKVNVSLLPSTSLSLSREEGEHLINMIDNSDVESIRVLINNGLNINATIVGDGNALIVATRNNNDTLVNELIQLGADIDQPSSNDGTPLIVAVQTNNLKLIKEFIQLGANIDKVAENDETALINASRQGNYDVVELLVENGANVNLSVQAQTIRGYEQRSPLKSAKTTKIYDYLIQMGAKA